MRRLGSLVLLVLILCAAAAVGSYLYVTAQFERPGRTTADTTVIIPQGSGLDIIADRLAAAGVIDQPLIFKLGVRLGKAARDLKAGEFLFPAGVSMKGAAGVLVSGKTVVHRLTVPEGVTSAEVFDLLASADALRGEPDEIAPEGAVLPETYHFARNDSAAALQRRMREAMTGMLQEAWPRRVEGLPLSSPEEALVLASIVEKETAIESERALIAGVFINRLRKGMRLQSDPTVVYGITLGKAPLGRKLTRADLKVPSPYNTYVIDGLPPGPIANPGRAAIVAVLNPAETKYLYFVADGTGGHAFAKSLREHNRNVAKWRKVQRSKAAE